MLTIEAARLSSSSDSFPLIVSDEELDEFNGHFLFTHVGDKANIAIRQPGRRALRIDHFTNVTVTAAKSGPGSVVTGRSAKLTEIDPHDDAAVVTFTVIGTDTSPPKAGPRKVS